MRRRAFLLGIVLLASVFTGCSGVQTGNRPSATQSPTTTATAVPTDCPYYLTVQPATGFDRSDDAKIVPFETLAAERQDEFVSGVQTGGTKLGQTLPVRWERPQFIRYENMTYRTVAIVC
jgi:hypothetical protein